MQFDNNNHGNLYLSIGSALSSLLSCAFGYVTYSGVAWLIGAVAGCVSIYAGILTIKDKRMSIKTVAQQ